MASTQFPEQDTSSLTNLQFHGRWPVSNPLDLPALLEQLAELLGPIAQSAQTMIFLLDPALNRYTLRRALPAKTPEGPEIEIDVESSIACWLGAHDQPLYLVDGGDQPPPHPQTQEEKQALAGMALVIPMRGERGIPKDRPRGWVALGPRPAGDAYSPDDLRLMAALVDRAALVIEYGYLHQDAVELDREKIEFMDFVAHELKQPMTSIRGYAKMLTLGIGGELSETQGQFAQVITANVDRMGKLVNDLLEISRLEAGRIQLNLEQLRPREILDEALATMRPDAEAREHTLETHVPADLPPITGDRDRLLQILGCLLSNACHYTPKGGTIQVGVTGPDAAAVPPGFLLFSVSDTGIGISAEDLANLDKFFRADHDLVISQPGLGLGIAIARDLIALHGGELMIESEPGRGSIFSFTMPIAQGSAD